MTLNINHETYMDKYYEAGKEQYNSLLEKLKDLPELEETFNKLMWEKREAYFKMCQKLGVKPTSKYI